MLWEMEIKLCFVIRFFKLMSMGMEIVSEFKEGN